MSQMMKPNGSPACWGSQFTDGEKECMQCAFKEGCRMQCMNRAAMAPAPLVQLSRPPGLVQPSGNIQLPTKPFFGPQYPVAPPGPPGMVYRQQQPPPQMALVQPPQQQITQYNQQMFGSLPDPNNPNPMALMMRPGAPQPGYHFTQYPGESTVERIGKNVVLRAVEAMFGELMFFFRHWTWPKNPRN